MGRKISKAKGKGKGKGKRISEVQRQLMFEFMERNEDVAFNKQTDPESKRKRALKWKELTALLNASAANGEGSVKNLKSWMRCWSDWKSNVRKKAADQNASASATGGGPPSNTELTPLEERLLFFIGRETALGLPVDDPMDLTDTADDAEEEEDDDDEGEEGDDDTDLFIVKDNIEIPIKEEKASKPLSSEEKSKADKSKPTQIPTNRVIGQKKDAQDDCSWLKKLIPEPKRQRTASGSVDERFVHSAERQIELQNESLTLAVRDTLAREAEAAALRSIALALQQIGNVLMNLIPRMSQATLDMEDEANVPRPGPSSRKD